MQLNISISLWNYIHYFPLRKGGTSFALDGRLGQSGKSRRRSGRRGLWR